MDAEYYKKYEPIFGAWTIKQKLGEGNFGAVYEIEREDFGTTYRSALKTITIPKNQAELESILDDGMDAASAEQYLEQFVEKIVGEFVLMSKLKGNSHIVSYEDHQVIKHKNGIGWDILIRMELLTPMMTYMKTTSITKRDVIKLGIDMCRALELCQRYNIIHRDIKPENIFISDSGDFKLGDFGIAKEVEKTQSGLTKTGTQTYMAPEVYKGQPYGSSVDMYSLGVVLYRLLNHNRAPFMPQYPQPISYSDRERALIMRMGGHKFPAPSGVDDSRLAEIALKACSFKPEDRYSSPTQMREDLEAILYTEGEGILMFPSGDNLDIKSVKYVSNSKSPNATVRMGDELTEVLDNDATEVIEDDSTEVMETVKKYTVPKTQKKKRSKIIIPVICAAIVAVAGIAWFSGTQKNRVESCAVMSLEKLNTPVEFKFTEAPTEEDYKIIVKRLEAYGCNYYIDKQSIAMSKADLDSNILATVHMLLGKGDIIFSNTANNAKNALNNSDMEKAEFSHDKNIASYAFVSIKEESKAKYTALVNEIQASDKELVLYVDGNRRYSVDASKVKDKLILTGDYDGKEISDIFVTTASAEEIKLSANYIRLIISIINNGQLSKSYEISIDDKYGIKTEEATDKSEETPTPEPPAVTEEVPEVQPQETASEAKKNQTPASKKQPKSTPKQAPAQNKNPQSTPVQKPPVQQTPVQQAPAKEAPVQTPVPRTPAQQTPVPQKPSTTNEDVPEIFDPTFD